MTKIAHMMAIVVALSLPALSAAADDGPIVPQPPPITACSPVADSPSGEATLGLATGEGTVVLTAGPGQPGKEVTVELTGSPEWDERSAFAEARTVLRRMIRQQAECKEPEVQLVDFGTFDDPTATGEADFLIELPSSSKEMEIKDLEVTGTVETWSDDGEPEDIEWNWRAACPAAVDEAEKAADSAQFRLIRGKLVAQVRGETAQGQCDIEMDESGSGLRGILEGIAIAGRVSWNWDDACQSAVQAAGSPAPDPPDPPPQSPVADQRREG